MAPDDSLTGFGSNQADDPSTTGGMPDLESLLHQASVMQERLVAAQHELEEARIEGSSGGGLVHATVTGTGELIGLTIDPRACDPNDPETLADLVLAAVQNAVDTAHRQAAASMGDISGGFGAGLGLGFGAGLDAGDGGDSSDGDSETSLW